MDIKTIDISSYNTVSSFSQVRADGYEYAILRATNRNNTTDTKFKEFYAGCKGAGIKTGVYKYSYALNTESAEREADYVIALLRDYPIELPVFYDLEYTTQGNLPKNTVTQIANAFIAKIKAFGYACGVYCNQNWYLNILDTAAINADYWWIAKYSSIPPAFKCDGWQYSDSGTVKGIVGKCNLSVFYTELAGKEDEADMEAIEDLQRQINEMRQGYDNIINKMGEEIYALQNPMIYNYIDDNMPEWARPAVQAAVNKGVLEGNDNGLDLSYSDLRILVILYRLGLFD